MGHRTRQPDGRAKGAQAAPTFRRFAARLLFYLFLASLLFSLGGIHRKMGPIQTAMAAIVAAGANALGAGVRAHGSVIEVGHLGLEINHECTGVFVLLVYAVFVLAYPAPWAWRGRGILVSVLVLTTVNVGRLVFLVIVADRQPTWVGYLHEYFFQCLFIALLALLAAVWTEQVRRATVHRIPG